MAKYHTGLEYHADETEKHDITAEDLEFLIALQKEMNTQDNVGQADPRYWVIKGSEKLYNVEGEEDGIELCGSDGCCTVADGLDEIAEFIKENLLERINRKYGVNFSISVEDLPFYNHLVIEHTEDGEMCSGTLYTAQEITVWLEELGCDEYQAIPYMILPKIYEDTMFLTQKAAEEHLRANSHHYSEDAHTYAMTSWRNPETEKLWKILQTVDFEKIHKD